MKLGSNYWKLWVASVTSNLGDGITTVAYPWLASAVTRSPVQIAGIAVATRLPWLFFTLPAGVITDRADRRRLIASMDAARMVVTLAVAGAVALLGTELAAPGTARASDSETNVTLLLVLYAAALVSGCAEVLRDNAAQTILPSIVHADRLETANGRLWGAEMVMNSFVGPPLGGFLIAIAYALPFAVDAATFGVSAVLIAALSGASFRATPRQERPQAGFGSEMRDGVRWLWNHPLLRRMGIILGIMNATAAGAMAIYVLYVQEILGLNASAFGLLLTAGAVGGVLGSALAARVSVRLGPGATLFVTILLMGLTQAVTGVTSSAPLVWVMFAVGSFMAVLWNVITVSLRQTIIPDDLLGRVNSVYRLLAWGMMPIGSIAGGGMVAAIEALGSRELGLRMPFLLGGAISVGLYLYARPVLNTRAIEAARAAAAAPKDAAVAPTE